MDAANGSEIASSVFEYPRWAEGLYCRPEVNQFRQHPLDYTNGLDFTVRDVLRKAGGATAAARILAISVDTTGSTPVAVNENGTPLSLLPGFENNPDAMFLLWKDHSAINEATAINDFAKRQAADYLKYAGGIYSSEWYWAKLLHILRTDKAVEKACFAFVEHCDWIPFLLTGGTQAMNIRRSRCAAGHKALWSAEWGGFPPEEFLGGLDYRLKGFRDRMLQRTYTADEPAGFLSSHWADRLGLSTQVLVGCGAFDAHMGAVGGQIKPYYLSKVMGTSTCDILVAPAGEMQGRLVKGICGQVDGSVIPGLCGLEAGQSAFGDSYAWFSKLISWPIATILSKSRLLDPGIAELLKQELGSAIIPELSRQAAALPPDENAELALDWLNGRRTPDADQELKSAISGLSLGSDAPRVFRAIAEATCFGARAITERFREQGIPIKGLIGIGGVARKSPYIMQLMADSLQMPISIHRSEQTCALGAAMFAATVAGIYPGVEAAMEAMGPGFDRHYKPEPTKADFYDLRYRKFQRLGYFIEEDRYEV